jgi:hypothetical protein
MSRSESSFLMAGPMVRIRFPPAGSLVRTRSEHPNPHILLRDRRDENPCCSGRRRSRISRSESRPSQSGPDQDDPEGEQGEPAVSSYRRKQPGEDEQSRQHWGHPSVPTATRRRPCSRRCFVASWCGLHRLIRFAPSKNRNGSPRCGTAWSASLAGFSRPMRWQKAQSGSRASWSARNSRQRLVRYQRRYSAASAERGSLKDLSTASARARWR